MIRTARNVRVCVESEILIFYNRCWLIHLCPRVACVSSAHGYSDSRSETPAQCIGALAGAGLATIFLDSTRGGFNAFADGIDVSFKKL